MRATGVAAVIAAALAKPLAAETVRSAAIYVIDGNAIGVGRVRFRLVGFDTPETKFVQCDYERALDDAETRRVRTLIEAAGSVELAVFPRPINRRASPHPYWSRPGNIAVRLIGEGLARPYEVGLRAGWY